MNKSKKHGPHWDRLRRLGHLKGMAAARTRAALAGITSVEELADVSALKGRPFPGGGGVVLFGPDEVDVPNPDQTESQVCYLVGAEGILNSGLTVLAARPVEQRPGLVLSVESRHNCVRGLFAVAVEEGVIVRSGWSGHGSAVYRVAS